MATKRKQPNTVEKKVKKTGEKEPKTTVTINDKTLLTFIDAIKDCSEHARIYIEENKLRVMMVDTGNVYMLKADCDCKTQFEKESPTIIGIDTTLVKKVLRHSKGCTITLTISKSEISIAYGRFTSKIPAVMPEVLRQDPKKEPDIILLVHFDLPGKYLLDACGMVTRGGRVVIYTKNKVVYLAAMEGDLCVKEVVGTVDTAIAAKSQFSNDYLSYIARSIKDVSARVDLGVDHPVRVSAEVNGCNLVFLLAPRIEAD